MHATTAALTATAGAIALGVSAFYWGKSMTTPRIIQEARKDLSKNITSSMPAQNSPLAEIFRLSGWSNYVDVRDGKIMDWCGIAVACWGVRSGLKTENRRALWATRGVEGFFTYGEAGSRSRLIDPEGTRGVHTRANKLRTWHNAETLRAGNVQNLPIQPGDVGLIAHDGRTTGADHIVLVESFDGRTLTTLEGNASGYTLDGQKTKSGVVRKTRDLTDPKVRKTLYGVGRFSPMDFKTVSLV